MAWVHFTSYTFTPGSDPMSVEEFDYFRSVPMRQLESEIKEWNKQAKKQLSDNTIPDLKIYLAIEGVFLLVGIVFGLFLPASAWDWVAPVIFVPMLVIFMSFIFGAAATNLSYSGILNLRKNYLLDLARAAVKAPDYASFLETQTCLNARYSKKASR